MSDETNLSAEANSGRAEGLRYQAPATVVHEALSDEELVVLDSETHRFYSLNSTAKRVYELAIQGLNEVAICQHIGEEFDIDPAECAADIAAILKELCEQGVLTKVVSAP